MNCTVKEQLVKGEADSNTANTCDLSLEILAVTTMSSLHRLERARKLSQIRSTASLFMSKQLTESDPY